MGEIPVVLANWNGRIFALHGRCAHQHLPLEGASMWEERLECPWHHFLYDVRTGENIYPSNVYPSDVPDLQEQLRPLGTYEVDLKGGEIWVNVE